MNFHAYIASRLVLHLMCYSRLVFVAPYCVLSLPRPAPTYCNDLMKNHYLSGCASERACYNGPPHSLGRVMSWQQAITPGTWGSTLSVHEASHADNYPLHHHHPSKVHAPRRLWLWIIGFFSSPEIPNFLHKTFGLAPAEPSLNSFCSW